MAEQQTDDAGAGAASGAGAAASTVRGSSTGEPIATQQGGGTPPPAAAAPPPATPPKKGASREVFSFTRDKLDERLAQARRATLREIAGTDDEKAIRERLSRADKLEKQAEDQRLASLSELERAKEEARVAREETERWRRQAVSEQERRQVEEHRALVERSAAKHVQRRYVPEASLAYARFLQTQPPSKLANWTERDADVWFEQYVADRKEISATATAPRTQERKPAGAANPPQTRPATTEAAGAAKTFKPGLANSMSRTEAQAEAKRLGFDI